MEYEKKHLLKFQAFHKILNKNYNKMGIPLLSYLEILYFSVQIHNHLQMPPYFAINSLYENKDIEKQKKHSK
jgi:hypothetical protein